MYTAFHNIYVELYIPWARVLGKRPPRRPVRGYADDPLSNAPLGNSHR